MSRAGIFLPALLIVGAFPFLPQSKEPPKKPAQSSMQTTAEQPNELPPGPIVIPPAAAKKVNPVKPTASSIATGQQRFRYDCAMCHGANGDGQGDLAKSMNLKLPDFRDPAALKSVTDGGLFYVISKGHKPMPNEETRAKPTEIWNLVNYVRSLSKKKQAQKSK